MLINCENYSLITLKYFLETCGTKWYSLQLAFARLSHWRTSSHWI